MIKPSFVVACVQNCAGDDLTENLSVSSELVQQAAQAGAELICLPENFTCLEERDDAYRTRGFDAATHPALPHFSTLARRLGVYLSLGSLTIKVSPERVANRGYVISPNGDILSEYDKIHLFDVRLKNGELYKESNCVAPGRDVALADLPWGKLGLSICYDLRFPQLYRVLARAGADFIAIPAAFTQTTGIAHWHVLVRARAIETGCFVFAAGQCGTRRWGRKTFGHSLIVDPWGEVIADAGTEPGYIVGKVELSRVAEVRAMIPALLHDREIGPPPKRND
ncbi:MAG: carbon-nitrogen hydrolase family protein [Gammaproteobacteria bacterium]